MYIKKWKTNLKNTDNTDNVTKINFMSFYKYETKTDSPICKFTRI